jgi:hypothetical protein
MSPLVSAEHRRATRAFWWDWLPSGLCVLLGLFLVGVWVVLAEAGLAKALGHLLGLVVPPLGTHVLRTDRRRAVGGPVGGGGRGPP